MERDILLTGRDKFRPPPHPSPTFLSIPYSQPHVVLSPRHPGDSRRRGDETRRWRGETRLTDTMRLVESTHWIWAVFQAEVLNMRRLMSPRVPGCSSVARTSLSCHSYFGDGSLETGVSSRPFAFQLPEPLITRTIQSKCSCIEEGVQ
ncbi:hypothetical protein EYF80_034396 [Liparis tanakae]|uniref:Uncharacterized protein n=1 Tax=Liparis tanakae TaxID=230148 RepID=A0A4Z2GRT7_9TELE|nr:hypothetical protein EYF80_034396 [Liparis tanakae]